jgi:catechol 2,3-dioxygenase
MSNTPAAELPATHHNVHPGVRIGHVHLRVADLDRALSFYSGVLGFQITQRIGSQAAFLSVGGYHHHIGLNTWDSLNGPRPELGATGLYHFALLYPERSALADALYRLIEASVALDGASDHGVSEALYLCDPDGNGVELSWDRPVEEWPRNHAGELAMFTKPLDLKSLLAARHQGASRHAAIHPVGAHSIPGASDRATLKTGTRSSAG